MSEVAQTLRALILASASTGRASVLREAGLTFEQRPARIDERALEADARRTDETIDPGEIALLLASAKAEAVSADATEAIIIGADQVMACEGKLFQKPQDLQAARRQLQSLRGKTHSLYSGLCVARAGETLWRHLDRCDLTMRNFSDGFLDAYCDMEGDQMLRSVGAYRIEGPGIQLFSRIDGDMFSIIGLPLLPLLGYLREIEWLRS